METLIIVCLASFCNSIMYTISYHYEDSVFSKLNERWWNPSVSWRNMYADELYTRKKLFWKINYPVQLTDAWHLFKSIKITLYIVAIFMYHPMFNILIDLFIFSSYKHMIFDLFSFNVFITSKH